VISVIIRRVVDVDVDGLEGRIRRARMADSRPLTEICALAGMTAANWYRIESGRVRALPIETLRAIEDALGVDFEVDV
jgi:transcriptional regulator with XRE-family HTH domain